MTDKEKIVPLKNFYVGVDERFHVAVHELAGKDWVEHADYAALESKFAAQAARIEQLTAENAYIKNRHQYIRALAVCIIEHSGGRMDWRGALEDARGLCQAVDDVFQNVPATDAALREIQIAGLIKFAEFIEIENPELAPDSNRMMKASAWAARVYADKIQAGEVQL